MLNNEQAFFLQILSDYVAVRTSQFSSSIHWNTIVTYAEKHELSGIFYNQCKQFIPAEQLMSLERKNAAEHFYYANNLKEYARISAILKKNNIKFALFKVLKIAKVYPLPYNRTMGDFDFLVDASQIAEIKASFDSLGYKLEKDTPHEWSFRRRDFYIEIHEFLLNPDTVEFRGAVSYFTTPWEHVCQIEETEYELNLNYHFVYLIQHMRQHLLWEGVGFRQFLDLALIIKSTTLDWDYIYETCRSIGLYDLLIVCMTFISRWFNVKSSAWDDMDEQFYYEATAKIFNDGVFGFSNDTN